MSAAVTHEKVGKTDQGLWKHKGWQLPAYVQHVANDLKSKTVDTSAAIKLALGIVRNWKDGHDGKGGKVSAATQAKAKAAWAEWTALKARAGGGKLKEAAALADPPPEVTEDDLVVMGERARGRLRLLESASLPMTGPGAEFDQLLVEAATSIDASRRRPASARARAERGRKKPANSGSNAEFDSAHPRARKGSRTGGEFVQSGSSGALVQAVQARVKTKADGQFGESTKRAVMAYQKAHGLKVDGIVGAQTAAALRGEKNAKDVAVGKLTSRDRQWLGNHGATVAKRVKRNGHNQSRLREAVATSALLDRVKGLEPGEHAMLPDGHAVRRIHTEDARDVYQAGSPDRYSSRGGVSWHGDNHGTPEQATAAALTNSARHDDPQSVGGTERFHTYTDVMVGGGRASFRGVNEHGQPLIRRQGATEPSTTTWYAMTKAPSRLLEAGTFREGAAKSSAKHLKLR